MYFFLLRTFFRDMSSLFSRSLPVFLNRTYRLNLKKKNTSQIVLLSWGFCGFVSSNKCDSWGLVNLCCRILFQKQHLEHNMTVSVCLVQCKPSYTGWVDFILSLRVSVIFDFFLVQRIGKAHLLTAYGRQSLEGAIK